MLKDIAKKLAQYYFFKDIERIVFMAFGAVEVMRFFVCEGAILAGAFFGALSGALIGGISGGIAGIRNGGSFLEGFADRALGGSLSGAITGAIFAALGLAGSALGAFLGGSCRAVGYAPQILKLLKATFRVTGVLSLGMDGFDTFAERLC